MSRIRIFAAVLLFSTLGLSAHGDTFVNRKTGQVGKGRVLLRETKEGREQILIKAESGKISWIWADEWQVVPDNTTESSPFPSPKPAPPPSENPPAPPDPHLTLVEVTGVGLTRDKAEQHAYTRAIEQAVGVLVDSETLVENDEIIRERILTFSRGYVQGFEVFEDWEEDGLQFVKARAGVAVSRLVEKISESGVEIKPLAGNDMRLQALHDLKAEANIAEMIAGALRFCAMDRLLDAKIEGEPEQVEKNPIQVKLRYQVRFSADMKAWDFARGRLEPLLEEAAKHRHVASTVPRPQGWPNGPFRFEIDRAGASTIREISKSRPRDERLVYLLYEASANGSRTHWNLFWVPATIIEEPLAQLHRPNYQLRIQLLDREDTSVHQVDVPLGQVLGNLPPVRTPTGFQIHFRKFMFATNLRSGEHYLGPLVWHDSWGITTSFVLQEDVAVPLQKLEQVTKTSVCIIETGR